jgi:arylsulfatase A-like enzyme
MKRLLLPLLAVVSLACRAPAADKPNILWITCEDMGPHLGFYGDKYSASPNLDAFAARGLAFKRAWSCAPVCAPARTTIISGLYPPSTGAEHMRSMVPLPAGMKMYPEFLKEAGYYVSNNSKEDYNLQKPAGLWDESSNKAHWKNRRPGQPFFAIFNHTITHESQIRNAIDPADRLHDPARVRVPAYHPDTPEVRKDWAQYYDRITMMDKLAGQNLKELADAGLADDTIVFFYSDHGSGMPRNKRWPGNSGLQVSFAVYFPEKWKHLAPAEYRAGGVSERLISFVDLAPTVLSIAGLKPPEWMQGHAFAGPHQAKPQPFIHGFRGRMDERYDLARSVTDGRYVYIRNYLPHLSTAQHVSYQHETPTTRVWKQLFDEGRLNEAQSQFWRAPRAPEELYDLENDPDEVKNLAAAPEHQAVLRKLRKAQQDLAREIRDVGFLPEGEIHSRSAGSTPYETGHDNAKYPFTRVFEMAEAASQMDMKSLPKVQKALKDKDSAVRYWAALGILMRGQAAVDATKGDLKVALEDESPYVRIVAANALGQHGNNDDLQSALGVLADAAPWGGKNNVWVSMFALNALDTLGNKVVPLRAQAKNWPAAGPSPDGRFNSYVPRLLRDIFGIQPAAAEPAKAKQKKAKER